MNVRKEFYDELLCSDVFGESKDSFAKFVFDNLCAEIYTENPEDTDSVASLERTKKNFELVVDLLNRKMTEKDNFLKNFATLTSVFNSNNESLKLAAKPIETNYSNHDKAIGSTIVSACAGILSCINFWSPAAETVAATAGTASLFYGAVVAKNFKKEYNLVQKKLLDAKALVRQELHAFSAVCPWFMYLEELRKNLDVLIDYEVLEGLFQEAMKFFNGLKYQTNLLVGEFKNRLKEMLQRFVTKMKKEGNLKFGNEISPVAITFVFCVCLWPQENRMVLECLMLAQRLKLDPRPALGIDALECEALNPTANSLCIEELPPEDCLEERSTASLGSQHLAKTICRTASSFSVQDKFSQDGVHETNNDHLISQTSSKAASQTENVVSAQEKFSHDGIQETSNNDLVSKKSSKVVRQTANADSAQENFYQEGIQKNSNFHLVSQTSSKAVCQTSNVASAQEKFSQNGIQETSDNNVVSLTLRKAVRQTVSSASVQEMFPQFNILERLLNLGNATHLLSFEMPFLNGCKTSWFDLTAKIDRAADDFKKAFAVVEDIYDVIKHYELILKTEVIPLTTILVLSVPEDAGEEDLKLAFAPFLSEEAWNDFQLHRISTEGSNWSVQVLPRHSQLLFQQTALVVKGKSCAVVH